MDAGVVEYEFNRYVISYSHISSENYNKTKEDKQAEKIYQKKQKKTKKKADTS